MLPTTHRSAWSRSTLRACAIACALSAGLMPGRGASAQESQAETPSTTPGEIPAAEAGPDGFRFGSYGRVMAGSDLNGGRGRPVSVVNHGPRLIEDPYLELDLGYTVRGAKGATFETLVTVAVTDALFHLDGDFDGALALRNAYVEARDLGVDGLSFWAGSRMYRGDDIYLLDLWPLDNLNTVGGGLGWSIDDDTDVRVHAGLNQLSNPFQYQTIDVAAPTFGTEQVILLDRVRTLVSARVERRFPEAAGDVGFKAVVYGDYQAMGEGEFENEDEVRIDLPSDLGYTVGAELGTWGFAADGFANVFARYSRGLAAYGELSVPFGFDGDRRVTSAHLVRLGTSAGARWGRLGVLTGAYIQWFRDGDDAAYDTDDYAEGVFVVRPMIRVTDHFRQAFEVSYQRRIPQGLSARSDTFLEPAMWQFGVMPTLATGPELFARPELRLLYAVSLLNDGALDRYPEDDPRYGRDVQHFLGIGAEWWFNSSTY